MFTLERIFRCAAALDLAVFVIGYRGVRGIPRGDVIFFVRRIGERICRMTGETAVPCAGVVRCGASRMAIIRSNVLAGLGCVTRNVLGFARVVMRAGGTAGVTRMVARVT